jgi:Flp pilus assembly protein TadB
VVVAALAVGWLVGGPTGWVLAVGVGWALGRWVSRAEPAGAAARRRTRAAALPTSVDLLVACLRAGADPLAAVTAVADSSPDTLGRDLGLVARRLELGATPAEAWALAEGTDLQAVARVVARSSATGAPVADLLETLAVELRAQRREQWLGDARQLGTRSAAPLGLCFLPGFVLLGVVPVVVGLAGGLW